MASSRYAIQALKWSAIGTNVYVFSKWNFFSPPKETVRDGKIDQNSRVFNAAKLLHQRYMYDNYTISQHNINEGRWYTMITSAFSHKGLSHLAVNMFMLHQATEIATLVVGLGPLRLTTLALGSALGGSMGSLYDNSQRIRAGEPDMPGLGASGIVQGMLVATMLAAPRLPMNVFFIPVEVSYRMVVGGFLAWDMYNLYQERTRGGHEKGWTGSYVGYAAHLGGAAFGAAFYLVAMRRGRPMPPPFKNFRR